MSKCLISLFAGLLLFLNPVYAQKSLERKKPTLFLSLNQAIQNTLKSSPTFITAKNQLEAAALESRNAFAEFLPSLDLTASHGVRGIEPDRAGLTKQTPAVSGATLSLTENLYNNGESFKKNKISDYKYELAKLNYQKNKALVIKTVTLAYYRYNIAAQNLRFTIKNYDELERLSNLLMNQFHQGMKTKKDYLGFKTRAQRGRLDVIRAEQSLAQARAALLAEIGLSPSDPVQFDESIKPTLPKKNLNLDIEPENLYEYKSHELQNQISELEVGLVERKLWPELNLVAAASYGSSNYIDTQKMWPDNQTTEWSVLLNIKFNLLDWGVRSRNIQIARLTQNTNQQAAQNLLLQSQKELEEFKTEVASSAERYKLSKELQQLEEDSFKILERDYRSGQTTYLELITGLANLLDAQARGQEADFDQANLYLRWKYYKGILSEETIAE